jgi:hypothetical protein
MLRCSGLGKEGKEEEEGNRINEFGGTQNVLTAKKVAILLGLRYLHSSSQQARSRNRARMIALPYIHCFTWLVSVRFASAEIPQTQPSLLILALRLHSEH